MWQKKLHAQHPGMALAGLLISLQVDILSSTSWRTSQAAVIATFTTWSFLSYPLNTRQHSNQQYSGYHEYRGKIIYKILISELTNTFSDTLLSLKCLHYSRPQCF